MPKGGSRPGSGRKKGPPTDVLHVRLPLALIDEIKRRPRGWVKATLTQSLLRELDSLK